MSVCNFHLNKIFRLNSERLVLGCAFFAIVLWFFRLKSAWLGPKAVGIWSVRPSLWGEGEPEGWRLHMSFSNFARELRGQLTWPTILYLWRQVVKMTTHDFFTLQIQYPILNAPPHVPLSRASSQIKPSRSFFSIKIYLSQLKKNKINFHKCRNLKREPYVENIYYYDIKMHWIAN